MNMIEATTMTNFVNEFENLIDTKFERKIDRRKAITKLVIKVCEYGVNSK